MQGRFARTASGEAAIGIPLVGGAARCRDREGLKCSLAVWGRRWKVRWLGGGGR